MRTELIEILQKRYPEYCMQHIDTADEILRLFSVDCNYCKLSEKELELSITKEEKLSDSICNEISNFIEHCKDNGLEIPDSYYESYLGA